MNYTEEQLEKLRKATAETPVDECFEWNGVKFRVRELLDPCTRCALHDLSECYSIACVYNERKDGKNVIFYKEEGGEQ